MSAALRPNLPPRFSEVRFIGEGAMGIVYEVWDTERQERLALKTLHKTTPTDIREFKREFRMAANLSHPNLVALHELFFESEQWFFTMELVDGRCLIPPEPSARLPEAELRERFSQLARGIDALHQSGILHRDIKPANVLVENSGRVVLLDFGLAATLRSGLTTPDAEFVFAGSPGYMAPEQLTGQKLTPSTDWYSFGVTLYEALCGSLPFQDQSGSTLVRSLSGRPTPLSDYGVAASPDLEELCMRLLSRDPEARPNSTEISRVLAAVSSGPVSGEVTSPKPTLVGRKAELSNACHWLSQTGRAVPRVAVLRGPSGIGKSTLAREILTRLSTPGAWLAGSRCMPQEAVPFNAWDGIVDELCDSLHLREFERGPLPIDLAVPRLFPVLGSLQGLSSLKRAATDDWIEARTEGMRGLRELLQTVSAERPLLLFIDDIQWGDLDSVRLLRELVTGQEPPSLFLVITLRDDMNQSSAFEELMQEEEFAQVCRVFDIGPLPENDAIELLDNLGVRAGPNRDRVLGEAGGDPFLLSELAHWDAAGPHHTTVTLSAVLNDRLSRLPAEAQELFRVVGLVGRPVPLDVALQAAAIGEGGLEATHRLRAAGLVRLGAPARKEVETYHDRWRSALFELLDEPERRQRFAKLALAFEERQLVQDAEVLTTCYAKAGNPEAAAKHALVAAASATSTFAFDRAARFYETALELGRWDDAQRVDLLGKLGVVAHAAGWGARAGEAFRQAAQLSRGTARIDLLRQAAQALLSSGRPKAGLAELDEVLAAVGYRRPRSTAATLAQLLFERWRLRRRGLHWRKRPLGQKERLRLEALDVAASTWVLQDPIVSWIQAMRLLRLALDGDDERLLLRAVGHELVFAAAEIHNINWLDSLVELGQKLTRTAPDPAALAWFRHAIGMRHMLAGEWEKAEAQLNDARRMFRTECTAVHWELCLARERYVGAVQIVGDMAAPEAQLRDWLEDAELRDDRESIASHLFGLGYCQLSNGTPEKVWPMIERVRGLVGERHEGALGAAWLEGITLCYEQGSSERLQQALRRIRRVHKTMQGRVLFYRVWSRSYEARVLGALAARSSGRERERFLRDMERTRQLLLKDNWHTATVTAKSLEACLAFFAGQRERSARLLDEVAQSHAQYGAKLFAATARHASATVRAHRPDLEQAIEQLYALNVADPVGISRAHFPAFY